MYWVIVEVLSQGQKRLETHLNKAFVR